MTTGRMSAPQAREKRYFINEIFYSLQGEGIRTGEPSLFLRFGKCNLRCNKVEQGFDCDTEFDSGRLMMLSEILEALRKESAECRWVILTGGEPALQVDEFLIDSLHEAGYRLAIETNGTKRLPNGLDWICVSPKTDESLLRQLKANEVKYVRAAGAPLPETRVEADYYLLSPAFEGTHLPRENVDWCLELAKKNPRWRISLQTHKFLEIR